MKRILPIIGLVFITGCASITSESTQLIRVDTLDEDDNKVADAKCTLTNDKGEYLVRSGEHAKVNKSAKDLHISCVSEEHEKEANGTAISRASAGMFGNIIFGGGVGAIIDHNRGTAYNYPEWVQLVVGKTLIFDRSKHKDGVPMIGEDPKD